MDPFTAVAVVPDYSVSLGIIKCAHTIYGKAANQEHQKSEVGCHTTMLFF